MQTASINHAIETFKRFVYVQDGNPREDKSRAIDNFALGCDITPYEFEHLSAKLQEIIESTKGGYEFGWAVIGFLLGVYASIDNEERAR